MKASQFKHLIRYLFAVMITVFGAGALADQVQEFSTPTDDQTFTVAEGVSEITVEVWAGGGKGGDTEGNNAAGGGGGAGGYASAIIDVSPGDEFNLVVGSGGTAGSKDGGASSFGIDMVTATGGGGLGLQEEGGQGGEGSFDSSRVREGEIITGGSGTTGSTGGDGSGGNGGNAPDGVDVAGGSGGSGGNDSDGDPGGSPGGGGGGGHNAPGGGKDGKGPRTGGSGGDGLVRITYQVDDVTLPVFDNFESYQPGAIDGKNGGTNWGGPWGGQTGQAIIDTSDNPLEFVDSQGRRIRSATTLEITRNNDQIVSRPLDGTFSGDSVFLSMLVRFTGAPTNNDFIGFWVEESGYGASPQFGLKVNEGGGETDDFFVRLDRNADYSTDLEVGETYLLVAQYSKGDEEYFSNAKLWVNPECEASPPTNVSAERSGFPPESQINEFSEIGIRSAFLDENRDAFEIGQVAVGTRWTDVVRCSPGPLVEYRMEQPAFDGTTGEVIDTTGNGRNATSQGGTQTSLDNPAIAGNPGTCRYGDFDGTDDRIVDNNAASYLEGLEAVTVMAWVYNTASFDGNDRGIFFTGASTNGRDNRFGLRYDTDGFFGDGDNVIKASVYTSDCNNLNQECWQVETESNVMRENAWQHVAMTWTTSGEIKVYVDGSEVGTSGTQGDGGTGQLTAIDKLEIGQGAKGQRWQGGIDEFRIFGVALTETEISAEMNRVFPCDAVGPNHIRLNHPSTGLTCTPAQGVTVQACANADDNCSEKYSEEITVDLKPASGWIPGRTVTFTQESEALALRSTTEGRTTLGVENTSVATTGDPGLRCFADGSTLQSNCEIIFAKSGFFFDVPDHISGKEVQVAIQALKEDENDPVQCVPAFTGNKDVEFATLYQNPTTGTLPVTSGSKDLIGNSLTLDFDNTATANFPLQYRDVGGVLLEARYQGSGEEAGLEMVGRNDFVARPDRFEVVVAESPNALNLGEAGKFRIAGQNFDIEVRSLNILDELTPNFGKESPREAVALNVVEAPTAPVPNLPALQGGLGLFGESCAALQDGKACGEFSWPEVGAFALDPVLKSQPYLDSEPVNGETLEYVGRFYPSYFDYAIDAGTFSSKPLSTDRTSCTGSRDYVYTGEPFSWGVPAEIIITPKNLGGVTVENYSGTQFQLLVENDIIFKDFAVKDSDAKGADTSALKMQAALGTPSLDPATEGDLIYGFSGGDEFWYSKSRNARIPGFTPQPLLTLQDIMDSDGVTVQNPATELPQDFTPAADFQIRYGRIALENSYGPEDLELVIPLMAEVYGNDGFEPHEDESCWFYDLPESTTLNYDESVLDSAQTQVVEVPKDKLTLDNAIPQVSPGNYDYRLRLSASGQEESPQEKGVYVELGVGSNWLKDYWDADNPDTLVDPYAWATFGVYRGHDRIIYWREVSE